MRPFDPRMRVLLVAHAFPPTFGGVETHLWDLARELTARRREVHCLVGGDESSEESFDGFSVRRRPELTVRSLVRGRRGLAPHELNEQALAALEEIAADALESFCPDVAHIHNAHHFAPELARAFFCAGDVPLVNGVHDRIGEDLYPDVLSYPWRHTLFASRYLRDTLPAANGPASVLLLGIDLANFTPDGERDGVVAALEHPVVFHPARLLRWKGVEVGLEAFILLRRRMGAGSLVMCASRNIVDDQSEVGRLRTQLEARADEAGVAASVHFLDIPRAHIADVYRASDLVWYPTIDNEPFGLVPLEAMACAVPLVVSDSGGMRETVLPGETGLVVPKRDAPALAASCIRLLGDASLRARLTAGGLLRAREFDIRRYVPRLERVYRMSARVSA